MEAVPTSRSRPVAMLIRWMTRLRALPRHSSLRVEVDVGSAGAPGGGSAPLLETVKAEGLPADDAFRPCFL